MIVPLAPQIIFFILAGTLHVIAPDHWLPASVLAWQRGWSVLKTIWFCIGIFFAHVLSGYLFYWVFQKCIPSQNSAQLFLLALFLMFAWIVLRVLRLVKLREVFQLGYQGIRGSFTVLFFLGPCEVMIPMFVKAKSLGMGYAVPFTAFLLGTWIAGIFLVLLGRFLWDRPLVLPWGINWIYRRIMAFPLVAGVTVNVLFLYFF